MQNVTWPHDFVIRPPRPDEAEQVTALICACDMADTGEPDWSVEETRADWARLGFDPARDGAGGRCAGRPPGCLHRCFRAS